MEIETVAQLISTVGFPIAACVVMFYQNDKLQKVLGEVSQTLVQMSERLSQIEDKVDEE